MALSHIKIRSAERTFVVGDIHGQDALLEQALNRVGFNPDEGDLLFSLGDLIDRGPQNAQVIARFSRPGHYAVLGNHDAMFRALIPLLADNPDDVSEVADYLNQRGGKLYLRMYRNAKAPLKRNLLLDMPDLLQGSASLLNWLLNGGSWFFTDLTATMQQQTLSDYQRLAFLPAISLQTSLGVVGLAHATVPGNDWNLASRITDAPDDEYLWDRTVSDYVMHRARQGTLADAHAERVRNADMVLLGHTITPTEKPVVYGNRIYMDTGAARGNVPTVMSLTSLFSLL